MERMKKELITEAKQLLKRYFGYESFRSGQERTIQNVLSKTDSICIMPTGGGKSICYQIPALLFSGTSIVISPLISLMKDQVDVLNQLGIRAAYINSSLSQNEIQDRLFLAKNGEYKILYVAPERLESGLFLEQLKELEIPFIAVDEAHCVSQWGHDFRPSYLNIGIMIKHLKKKPILLALTATATPNVRKDICKTLEIDEQHCVLTGFERENLSFNVIKGQDRDRFLLDYLKKNSRESGIIYAATRKTVDSLYEKLRKEKINVGKYHAGLSDQERAAQQDQFLRDDTTIMVATSAFGMGIDKSNVRYVIHYQLPKNMEGYYQEAGRAGRDGLPSQCFVLFSSQDVQIQRFLIEQTTDSTRMPSELDKLQNMVGYCHTEGCLQTFILEYFGESGKEPCGRCGNCQDERASEDVTSDAQKVLSCMVRMGQRFGKTMISQVLTGSKNKKILELSFQTLSTYGIMSNKSIKDVSEFIEFLISEGYILIEQGPYPTLYVGEKGKSVLTGQQSVRRKETVKSEEISSNDPLFDLLRQIRKDLASEENVPPFVIFSDQSLQDMCLKMPITTSEFLEIKGVGNHKLDKYGAVFISAIVKYKEQNPDQKPVTQMKIQKKNKEKKATTNSHLTTYELFANGLLIENIAQERDLSVKTIENHLLQCFQEGLKIDLSKLVPNEFNGIIEKAVKEAGTERLKPIKELVPDEISYFMIRCYLLNERVKDTLH